MQTTWLIYSSPDLNFQMRAVRPKAKRKLWIFHGAFFPSFAEVLSQADSDEEL